METIAGNAEDALDWLDKALAHSPDRRGWAKQDPDLESLREYPRYQQMTSDK